MPLYEHVFLARQDISQAQVDALLKEFSGIVEAGGGRVVRFENAGLKTVAYKIKKNRKAHYALMNIDAPAPAVAEMERRMGLSTDVIRFMTIKVEALETEPSALSRKSDREERGGRGGRFGDREGGGGFRPRGDREGGGGRGPRRFGDDRPPREDRPPRSFGDRPPREPRESRDAGPRDAGPRDSGPRDGGRGEV
jgi:small subunit ribosomal protein S6